jgi:hypothetical protein
MFLILEHALRQAVTPARFSIPFLLVSNVLPDGDGAAALKTSFIACI